MRFSKVQIHIRILFRIRKNVHSMKNFKKIFLLVKLFRFQKWNEFLNSNFKRKKIITFLYIYIIQNRNNECEELFFIQNFTSFIFKTKPLGKVFMLTFFMEEVVQYNSKVIEQSSTTNNLTSPHPSRSNFQSIYFFNIVLFNWEILYDLNSNITIWKI